MTREELVVYYEKRLADQRDFYEEENTAAIAEMQKELDKARLERFQLVRQIRAVAEQVGKDDAELPEVAEDLLKLITAGRHMMAIQKTNETSDVLQGIWKQYMMALRMTGNDGTPL